MAPIITAVNSPVSTGNQIRAVGTDFGFVSAAALVNSTTLEVVDCPDFIVDSGMSLHLTVPRWTPVGFYEVYLGTLHGEHSTNVAGLVSVLNTTIVPAPFPDLVPNGSSIERVRARLRVELGDYLSPFTVDEPGDGTRDRYDLPAETVMSMTAIKRVDGETVGTPLVEGVDYTLDIKSGTMTLTEVLPVGTTLFVRGMYAQFFTDAELDMFIESALAKHTHGASDRVVIRDPLTGYTSYTTSGVTLANVPTVEEHPIALLAAIEALWALAADASYDIDVVTAEGTSLPRQQRYHSIMEMIERQQNRYDTLSSQLNVGLNRIEMFTLRRISRTTGRYVPVYIGREYDENQPPIRVYPPVDSGITGSGSSQRTFVGQQYPPGV